MRLVFYHVACYLLLTIIFAGNTFGQIYKVNADTVIVASIIHADTSIHVFYTNTTGSLKARSPKPGPATFEWTKYDTIYNKRDFSIALFDTDSIVNNLPSGGYKVHIKASDVDTSFVAWVFIDSLKVNIEKDVNGDIKYLRYTCDYTDLRATYSQSKFIYYDSKNKKQILPTPTFIWSIDSAYDHKLRNFTTKDSTSWLRMDTTKGMPYEKAKFYAQVKDKFGATSKLDWVKYTPVVCKSIPDTTGSHPVYDHKNSAPFTVTFLNKSKNAVKYLWKFSTDPNDTAKRNDTVRITHTYYITSPNDTTPYKVFLISKSLQECVDTAKIPITVAPGQIEHLTEKSDSLPNYFTPGGNYKKFRIYNISIRQFRFTVFSRWGKKVYEAEGPDMLDWEGWDGDVLNSGRPAPDGIYYYVLEVISWDKTPNPEKMRTNGKYSGFFYLFRAK